MTNDYIGIYYLPSLLDTLYMQLLHITEEVSFFRFPPKSDSVWLPVSRCGHACVCQCSELNKMWRWVSRELVLEWAGLMCSQQTSSDPSSACLNWAPGFIQCRVDLQYSALYKSLLHRRPLRRGHCSSFIHTWMHTWTVHKHTETHACARTHARHTLLLSRPVQRAKLGTKLYYQYDRPAVRLDSLT